MKPDVSGRKPKPRGRREGRSDMNLQSGWYVQRGGGMFIILRPRVESPLRQRLVFVQDPLYVGGWAQLCPLRAACGQAPCFRGGKAGPPESEGEKGGRERRKNREEEGKWGEGGAAGKGLGPAREEDCRERALQAPDSTKLSPLSLCATAMQDPSRKVFSTHDGRPN